MDNPRLETLAKKASSLPLSPGVYLMKDKTGKIIYVGKAKALRNRVSSYFRSVEKHLEKVYRMVENAVDFDTILTDSEYEALMLECSLIKQYRPKYNIIFKDDKGYPYIKISDEPYPRISYTRQKKNDGTYLGPFTSSFMVHQVVEEAVESFLLPTCRRKFPQEIGKDRPCLNHFIGRCMGVCAGKISQAEYAAIISEAVEFVKTGSMESVESLTGRMNELSEALEFEQATRLRDRIRAMEKITEKQVVVTDEKRDIDVIALVQGLLTSCFSVLRFRAGRLCDKEDFIVELMEGKENAIHDFVMRYYTERDGVPNLLYVSEIPASAELLSRFLGERGGRKCDITVPQRGDGAKILEMARKNAAETLARETLHSRGLGGAGREVAALDELKKLLGLPAIPSYIEAYDISNFGDRDIVGGMVVFQNGLPYKRGYKRFLIKTLTGQDDYAAMCEVIRRRFSRYLEDKDTGEGFGRMPDLLLIDGGLGHVNAVTAAMWELGIDCPVFGMVKDGNHRTRAITGVGEEIAISQKRSAFTLVSKIQDEVHRFAITYQRLRRKKTAFESELTKISGIGERRASELMRHFRTVKAMKEATLEELCEAPGMTRQTAENLRAYLDESGGRR